MRPFFSYSEGRYAEHWLTLLRQPTDLPVLAHVNWFQRDPEDGHYLWPGYRENLRALNWLLRYRAGDAHGQLTPVGVLPPTEELDLIGLDLPAEDLDRLPQIDTKRWAEEMQHRHGHLSNLRDLPQTI